ncbi:Rieske 2Fe-2S domain-containing protein [Gordonia sp. JH63]|uniref:aromatic ring-hydroxylating oxygenase subunit alpha n=1 Tax=Gordonia sp. JH63 TaxID=2698900 RepID=UPI00083AF3E2|nr:aromatic ring-hydroxylating dioxygenase subunit alpha [Gordonia sp. JH63]OCW84890.1 (Fe-S)-binding protein [Nocardia farcinica]QHD85016.1 Rieske 2Fe-2S domain-containing protein [Gordonia sp. JH63]
MTAPFVAHAATRAPETGTRALIADRRAGESLPAEFYVSREFFDLDVDEIFSRSWIFVATEAEITDPGDYVTITFSTRSVIVVRDDDGRVRAHHNVCRHRGARLLTEPSGSTGTLVCTYHSWTYGMDGRLEFADDQAPGFDKSCYSLRSVHVRTIGGLVFICLADDPPADIDEVAAVVEPYLTPHRLAEAKVAKQVDIVEDGNWKLTMENNRECYHCGGHPELLNVFFPTWGYSDTDAIPSRLAPAFDRFHRATAEQTEIWDRHGLPHTRVVELDTRATGFHIERDALDLAGESFTLDGSAACGRLLTDIPDARLGRLSMHLQPNMWLHVTSDHAVLFAVIPVSADQTLVRTTWLVHRDAVEGVDYDLDQLTGVWEKTNQQDADLVALAHSGISDPAYVPGPYSTSEIQVEAFVNWYVTMLRHRLDIPAADGPSGAAGA